MEVAVAVAMAVAVQPRADRLVQSAAWRSVLLKSLATNNSGTCSRWARA
jgi:hypothetical protein